MIKYFAAAIALMTGAFGAIIDFEPAHASEDMTVEIEYFNSVTDVPDFTIEQASFEAPVITPTCAKMVWTMDGGNVPTQRCAEYNSIPPVSNGSCQHTIWAMDGTGVPQERCAD